MIDDEDNTPPAFLPLELEYDVDSIDACIQDEVVILGRLLNSTSVLLRGVIMTKDPVQDYLINLIPKADLFDRLALIKMVARSIVRQKLIDLGPPPPNSVRTNWGETDSKYRDHQQAVEDLNAEVIDQLLRSSDEYQLDLGVDSNLELVEYAVPIEHKEMINGLRRSITPEPPNMIIPKVLKKCE